jgi:hypothetical protein
VLRGAQVPLQGHVGAAMGDGAGPLPQAQACPSRGAQRQRGLGSDSGRPRRQVPRRHHGDVCGRPSYRSILIAA